METVDVKHEHVMEATAITVEFTRQEYLTLVNAFRGYCQWICSASHPYLPVICAQLRDDLTAALDELS